jgi:cell division septation protein DedD
VTKSGESKSKKENKPYQLVLGFKKLLLTTTVLLVSLVWVFALGVLVGRGDAYQLLHRWGLMKVDPAAKTELIATAPGVPNPTQTPAQTAAEAPVKTDPGAGSTQPLAPAEKKSEAPTAETKAPPSPPGDVGKATPKSGNLAGKKLLKESVATKLSFQNSLDSNQRKAGKLGKKTSAQIKTASIVPTHDKTKASVAKTKNTGTPKSDAEAKKPSNKTYQVQLGSFRKNQEAEKAVADLKKKGYQVSCQTTKDGDGVRYVVKTNRLNSRTEAEKVSQKLKESRWPTCKIEEGQR